MCAYLTDYEFNTEYLRSSLLKKDLFLVFLFLKYNIVLLSIKMKVYSKNEVLLSSISSVIDVIIYCRRTVSVVALYRSSY